MVATFRELQDQAHNTARGKGWWDPYMTTNSGVRMSADQLLSKLMLIVTEVAEACEEVRDDQRVMRFENGEGVRYTLTSDWRELREGWKPEGLPAELADVVIRCLDLAGALGIDLDEAVRIKMEFNRHRKHRHGGRLA